MRINGGQIVAIVSAVCALAAIATGAHLTTTATFPGGDVTLWKNVHRGVSTVAGLGGMAAAFLVTGGLRLGLLVSVLLAALPGGMLEARAMAGLAGVIHAVGASAMTSLCAVAVLRLSAGWGVAPDAQIEEEGSPSLATLARLTWIGLLAQTALGALYRHHMAGLMAHIIGAMLVMGMVMYAGIATFSTEKAPGEIKGPALALLVLTGVQMLIGLGAYLYRVDFTEQATGRTAMLTFTMIHVAVGALTTACSALMGMQISRHVRPAVVAQ